MIRTLQKGEKPTVNSSGTYNEFIPPGMKIEEDWPVGMLRMDVSKFTEERK